MIRDNSKIFNLLGESDYKKIKHSTITVIGCGSIGSNILEYLTRMGVVKLVGIDNSVLSENDITDHLTALKNNLHEPKTIETKKRLFRINESVYFTPINKFINEHNAHEILSNTDLVISTVPNMEVNLLIEDACSELDTPLIIANTNKSKVYITTQFPGDFNLEGYAEYMEEIDNPDFASIKSPYAVPYITSLVLREAFNIILSKGNTLKNKLLISNMENYETQIVLTDHDGVEYYDDENDENDEPDEDDDVDDVENEDEITNENDSININTDIDKNEEISEKIDFLDKLASSKKQADEEINEVDEILHMEM